MLIWRQLFWAMFRPFSIQINLNWEWPKHRLKQLSSGKQITLIGGYWQIKIMKLCKKLGILSTLILRYKYNICVKSFTQNYQTVRSPLCCEPSVEKKYLWLKFHEMYHFMIQHVIIFFFVKKAHKKIYLHLEEYCSLIHCYKEFHYWVRWLWLSPFFHGRILALYWFFFI